MLILVTMHDYVITIAQLCNTHIFIYVHI
uniref:Uncharacterized protein n=1 Tax=Anguilla anguilla TaxID=7936 RepID=A0A0E9Q7V3_ANGAN